MEIHNNLLDQKGVQERVRGVVPFPECDCVRNCTSTTLGDQSDILTEACDADVHAFNLTPTHPLRDFEALMLVHSCGVRASTYLSEHLLSKVGSEDADFSCEQL